MAMFAFTATSHAITLKLGHAAPESDLQQDLSLFFKHEIEARTHGKISVNIFPNGELGTDVQMIDLTRSGIIDLALVGLNNYSSLVPESAVFSLPFMFPNRQKAYEVLDGKVGQSVFNEMEQFGLKGLGYPENGFRNMTNNRGPIREPKDVEGLKMRVNNAKNLYDMFTVLKANPHKIPVADLYTALKKGDVNAQDHPVGITLSFQFYEQQKYLSLTQHAYSALALTMNLKTFNQLSTDDQKIITDVAHEAVQRQRNLSMEREAHVIAELESLGMQVNKDVDTKAFQVVVKPVWDSFIQEHGEQMIQDIQEVVKTH